VIFTSPGVAAPCSVRCTPSVSSCSSNSCTHAPWSHGWYEVTEPSNDSGIDISARPRTA
jgi:hypothetical protein